MGTVVDDLITRVFDEVRSLDEGELADYIPELAAVAPDSFGICIATVDGYVYEIGDSRIPFTIQSISKPFTYALALVDRALTEIQVDGLVGIAGDDVEGSQHVADRTVAVTGAGLGGVDGFVEGQLAACVSRVRRADALEAGLGIRSGNQ